MVRRGIAVMCLGLAACGPSLRVQLPERPPVTRPLVIGTADGVRVPAGMRVIAAYGEDAWRFAEPVRFGPAIGPRVLAWDARRIVLVAQATGQPEAAVWHDGATLIAVTADPGGTRIAALTTDGTALYWPRLDGPPQRLAARRLPTRTADDPGHDQIHGPGQEYPYVAREGDRESPIAARSAARLSFSADGTRLLAGDHLWELASGRDLIPLHTDELVLEADHDSALVARLIVVITEGQPGSQCGFVPTFRAVSVVALERRRVVGPTDVILAYGSGRTSLPDGEAPAPAAPGHASVPFEHVESIDLADDGRLAFVQGRAGWLVDGGERAQALRLPNDETGGAPSFESVTLGDGAIYAVGSERQPARVTSAAYVLDAGGVARARVPGMVRRIARDGRAVISRDGGYETWRLAGEPAGDDLEFRPKSLRSVDQGRAAGPHRVVVRDSEVGAALYVVHEAGRAPRTIRLPGEVGWQWEVSPDGSAAATADTGHLRAFSLDDGRVTLDEPLTSATAVWSVALSKHLVVAGDVAGRVRVWRDGVPSELDLGGRHDIATALAISPDERRLAIGTGRGRVFVVELSGIDEQQAER